MSDPHSLKPGMAKLALVISFALWLPAVIYLWGLEDPSAKVVLIGVVTYAAGRLAMQMVEIANADRIETRGSRTILSYRDEPPRRFR